jgi:hypothetical protein
MESKNDLIAIHFPQSVSFWNVLIEIKLGDLQRRDPDE